MPDAEVVSNWEFGKDFVKFPKGSLVKKCPACKIYAIADDQVIEV